MNQTLINFKNLIEKIPLLTPVLSIINHAKIKYGLYSGSHVSILTSNRNSADIDLLVYDNDAQKLKTLFSFTKVKKNRNGKFLYLGPNDEIEFVTHGSINIHNSQYRYRLTDLCWYHTELIKTTNAEIRLLNKADTILIKAMLQRGQRQNKHDFQDIKALTDSYTINKFYLSNRLQEVNKDTRLVKTLQKFHLH